MFNVIVTSCGDSYNDFVAMLREVTNFTQSACHYFWSHPGIVAGNLEEDKAACIADKLRSVGAAVEVVTKNVS